MLSKNKFKLLDALSGVRKDKLVHILKHIDEKGVESICECVFNTIYTDLKLSNPKRKSIKNTFSNNKKKRNLNIITNKNIDLKKKKRALLQEGQGIGLILATVAPLLAQLFMRKRHT
jgi:hypothetical protein